MAKSLFEVIFEDDDLVVVNKSPGLAVIPTRNEVEANVKDLLLNEYSDVFTVHRIDRDTSGIVLFARNEETHKALSLLFQTREVEKTYLAIVKGVPLKSAGVIDAPIEIGSRGKVRISGAGKSSITTYEVVEQFRGYSLLRLTPQTGRQHQIRIHLSHFGHPLVVDPLYGSDKSFNIADIKQRGLRASADTLTPLLQRTPLHAFSLNFNLNGQRYFEAPVPKDMKATLNQLKKWRMA